MCLDPAVFKDAVHFFFVPPSPGVSRGRVRTIVFLQKPGLLAGPLGGDFKFNLYFDLKHSWVEAPPFASQPAAAATRLKEVARGLL